MKNRRSSRKRWPKILSGDERDALFRHLVDGPDAGVVMPRRFGLRKVRWQAKGRGKSGGARVIYYWQSPDGTGLALLKIYPKSREEQISEKEAKRLRQVAEDLLS